MSQLNLNDLPDIQVGRPQTPSPIYSCFQEIVDFVNGALIGGDNLADGGVTAAKLADAARLGLTNGSTVRRGYAEVATSQSTSAAGPVALTTAGPSVAITIPSVNSLIRVSANVSITAGAGVASVFLTADSGATNLGPVLQDSGTANVVGTVPGSAAGTPTPAVTGELVIPGSVFGVGVHTLELRYGSASGSASFSDRRLWVRVESY